MNKFFQIGKYKIGENQPPFVIAEACINHEGNIDTAKEMIRIAHTVGVNCIKFQIHNLSNEMLKITPKSDNFDESLWDALERTNFNIDQQLILKNECEKYGIIYLCTPFSRDGADELDSIGVDFFKVGSGELTNLPLIEHIAKKNKPMIVSTGMSEIYEIKETVDLIQSIGNQLILTHCTSAYPCPYEIVNLDVINLLKEKFKVPVGLSDHTNDIFTSLGAVALGACIIEKHFTLDKTAKGPDHASSIEPEELQQLVMGSTAIYKARGSEKKIFDQEKQIISWARESVVSEIDIKKGETLSKNNIWVKRPGPSGDVIPAKNYNDVLGSVANVDIKKDTQIKWLDIKKI